MHHGDAVLDSLARSLPWLVRNGAHLGQALLATGILGGALLGACWTRAAAWLLAAWECARLGAPLPALDDVPAPRWAVIEGVVRFVDGRRCVQMADATVVELCGATRGYLRRNGRAPFIVEGDRVRVAGVLERAPSATTGDGYRGAARRGWQLVAGERELEVVLFAPRAVVGSPAWRVCAGLAGAAAAALVTCFAVELAGHLGQGDVARLAAGDRALLSELAATDPSWRANALGRFEQGYRERAMRDDAADTDVDRLVAMLALRGACNEAGDVLTRRGRAEDAVALEKDCPRVRAPEPPTTCGLSIPDPGAVSMLNASQMRTPAWSTARARMRGELFDKDLDDARLLAVRMASSDDRLRGRMLCMAEAIDAIASERVPPAPTAPPRTGASAPGSCAGQLREGGLTRPSGWLVALLAALDAPPEPGLDVAAAAIPLVASPEAAGSAPAIPGMAPAFEEEVLRALDEIPTSAARLAAARLAIRQAVFRAREGSDGTHAATWLAVAHHRLREAHEVARMRKAHTLALRFVARRPPAPPRRVPHCGRRRGCCVVDEDADDRPTMPRLFVLPPESALVRDPPPAGEPPSLEGLSFDPGGSARARGLREAFAATHASLKALDAQLPLAAPDEERAGRRRASLERAPAWEVRALETLRQRARDKADPCSPNRAAERRQAALRMAQVGLLVEVLDSL